jgi:hypothetical protein
MKEPIDEATQKGSQLQEKRQLERENLFILMTERMGRIFELVDSGHHCKSLVASKTP